MEQQMMEAARAGDISVLYALIYQDSNLLDEIENKSWVETPLHIAASHGKTQFALEMMVLKPSFVLKLNQNGLTPLHLAIQQCHTATALGLLLNNIHSGGGDIVQVKGKGGLTPLHCAAEKGNIELLLKFLLVNPRSMEDVTIGNETALHIALKNHQLDAFTILLGWVELGSEEGPSWEERFLTIKDHQGNTILDLATSNQLFQVVSLIANSRLAKYVDVSTANIPPPQNSEPPMSFLNDFTPLLSTDKRLNKAAYDGDTNALYAILREDRSILDRIDIASFVDTPLHIAASKGHTRFAKEIIKLKPSFANKLNQDGFSPLHLAIQNQETAVELVSMSMELVSVKGKDDMTPLHCATKMGSPKEILDKFLRASPKSINDLTIRKETALHIAVRYGNLDSLRFLWGWVLNKGNIDLLGLTDDEGNTVYDIAEHNQQDNLEIRQFLKNRVEAPLSESQGATKISVFTRKVLKTLYYGRFGIAGFRQRVDVSNEERAILLVVYTLIATTTYQAVLSPPGGVWQVDPSLIFPDQSTGGDPTLVYPVRSNSTSTKRQILLAGTTVLPTFLWAIFSALNTITFALSLSHICYMLPNKPFLFLPLACWVICYSIALYMISSDLLTPLLLTVLLFWWLDTPFNAMSLLQNRKISRSLVTFLAISLMYLYFSLCSRFLSELYLH